MMLRRARTLLWLHYGEFLRASYKRGMMAVLDEFCFLSLGGCYTSYYCENLAKELFLLLVL